MCPTHCSDHPVYLPSHGEAADDGLPSDTERVDRRSAIHPADSQDPASASVQAQTPRGPLEYAQPHWRRKRKMAFRPSQELIDMADKINPPGFESSHGEWLGDDDNSDIQAPADQAGDVLAELGALAATSAERERRRAAGDDGWRGFSSNANADVDKLCNAVYPADTIERATRTSKAMAPPNICGAGPAGDDFAAVPREPTRAKSAMVRIMELTALVEQARALAVQALTDIGSANQSELAAAGDHLLAVERTITERDARIAALEAAAQSAIEKLAGGTDV